MLILWYWHWPASVGATESNLTPVTYYMLSIDLCTQVKSGLCRNT
jgi:hypothetical protein